MVDAGTLVAGALANGIGGSGSSLGTGAVLIAGGTLRFGATSLLAVTNTTAGSVSLNGGTLDAGGLVNLGQLANLGNTSTIASDLSNQGTLNVFGGSLTVTGSFLNAASGIVSNYASLKVGNNGTGWGNNNGQVVLVNGIFAAGMITNAGTISGYGTLASALNNAGLVEATNGLLSIAGAATGVGDYRVDPSATLSFNAGGQISSLLMSSGATIRVGGGILTNLSAFSNVNGTLALAGGGYQAQVQFTNTGWLVGYGSFNTAAGTPLVNTGAIDANGGGTNHTLVINSDLLNTVGSLVKADTGALQINGAFTNNGTLQFISSVGTYSRAVVNDGTWRTSGDSASVFSNNFMITTNGYVSAAGGDRYVFTAGLNNQSTLSNAWDTLGVNVGTNTAGGGVKFLFSGSGLTSTQTFYTPGLLLTGGFDGVPNNPTTGVQNVDLWSQGFSNNFAVGELLLTNTTLVIAQTQGLIETNGALFVNDLYLYGSSHLVVSNDMTVYFVNSNGWTLADITLEGNAQIHQLNGLNALLVIPEPNVLLMWLCGGVTVWAARRRTRRQRQDS